MNSQIIHGDSLIKLKDIEDNSMDQMLTDPPYGYSFMNKDWDKAVVSVKIWRECLRVLKPGAFAFVMSAPRQDVLSRMIVNLSIAGFKTDFTSIYWAYASGFPKAANISKMVDKKLGKEREVIGTKVTGKAHLRERKRNNDDGFESGQMIINETTPSSDQAKKLDGSYAGFQPKPALEVILVCMKPLSEKNYIEQAMDNQKGITWLDDCRIPFSGDNDKQHPDGFQWESKHGTIYGDGQGLPNITKETYHNQGRFPANLLVSDDALNDGKITKSNKISSPLLDIRGGDYGVATTPLNNSSYERGFNDSGSFSRYFDEDAWQAQFLIVEKPSKAEKNKGLEDYSEEIVNDGRKTSIDNPFQRGDSKRKNTHPTVKPISLMSYLITMGSREGDTILDPFAGSGTTGIAASLLNRNYVLIERDEKNYETTKSRLNYWKNKTFEKLEKIKKQAAKEQIVKMEEFL